MRRLVVLGSLLAMPVIGMPAANAAYPYVQPNWLTRSHQVVEVLIVPPAHGQIYNGNGVLGGAGAGELTPFNSYLAAELDAIDAWENAIQSGPVGWLQALEIDVYVVGQSTNIPNSALLDPEVIIVHDDTKGVILGVTFSTNPCLIDNSTWLVQSFTYNDMFNVGGHEFGHCLGLDHTYGSPDDGTISYDIMHATYERTIGDPNNPKHCPSNLNIHGVARAFAPAFNESPAHTVGGTYTMSSGYSRPANC